MNAENDLYGLLEIEPGATEDEIRRAYKQLSRQFDPNSAVVYGLYRGDELQALVRCLKEAYETLLDPEKRRRYDRRLFPEGHPSLRRADQRDAKVPPEPRPAAPADPLAALSLPPETPLRGPVLARVRGVCHLSLEDIADRTKISMFTLRCIETEHFGDLPARVYLRGFLKQIADMLKLDADRVLADYMAGFDEWQAQVAERKPW